MRWGVKPPVRIGTRKFKVKFAFLPVVTHEGVWVWWERYLQEKVYISHYGWSGSYNKWETMNHHNDSYSWRKYHGEGSEINPRREGNL